MSVTPQGKSVQALYREYREGKFFVNRKYQRKLVWSTEEKQRLIDSILNGYPIPLILLAENTDTSLKGSYEIIDGIQRFNAIFTFIENSFDYDGRYFDVDQFTRAKQLSEKGFFSPVTDKPKLDPGGCANILDYQMAITIYPTTDESKITDVFGRINSGGRTLSAQEQRQAGVVSAFSKLVRTVSSELRGDVSREILLLTDMPEISVDSSKQPHGYGIQAEQTPWCRQGILSVKQLRESEDEQFIADIAASILMNEPVPASKELFDKYYNSGSTEEAEIEKRLAAYGVERLSLEIKSTFAVLIDLVESLKPEKNYLRSIVRPGSRYPIRAPFFTIFMAFFDLIVIKRKSPEQPENILKVLESLDNKLTKGTHYETTENRKTNINLTKGLIQDYFVDKVPPVLGHGPSLTIDFENALRRSKIETPRYEFKQGILRLDNNRSEDVDILIRIVETACGIANLGPDSDGYIFFGVADREAHADRIETLDGIQKRKIAEHFLVGIERETKILKISLDEYVKKVVTAFQTSKMTDPLKTQILSSFDAITIQGLTCIRIRIPKQEDISFVDGKAYYRENSSTIEIQGQRLVSVSKLFNR